MNAKQFYTPSFSRFCHKTETRRQRDFALVVCVSNRRFESVCHTWRAAPARARFKDPLQHLAHSCSTTGCSTSGMSFFRLLQRSVQVATTALSWVVLPIRAQTSPIVSVQSERLSHGLLSANFGKPASSFPGFSIFRFLPMVSATLLLLRILIWKNNTARQPYCNGSCADVVRRMDTLFVKAVR